MTHQSKDAPSLSTRKQKMQHFWDYIFPWCVGIGIALGVVFWLLADAFGTARSDYRIGFVCAATLSDETVELLEAAAAQHGSDLNRDGTVLVELDQYPLSYTGEYDSPYTQMAGVSMLSSDLQDVDFVCFIVENAEKFCQSCDTLLTLQGTAPSGESYEQLSLSYKELTAFQGLPLTAQDAALLENCRVLITKNPSSSTGRTDADHALWLDLLAG
ncbi:MAG: hypothetical protein IJ347_10530 [Faecalibacterium sp.]|nr:hypothetical protein [Faecalibacterium sp.]